MSFLTSFWFLPQKEQERFPCSSRLRSVGTVQKRSTGPARKSARSSDALGTLLGRDDAGLLDEHLVDDPVFLRLDGAHEVVALGVGLDAIQGLPGVLDQQLVELVARAQDLARVDVDVGRLPLKTTQRLVDQDAGVRQRK